MSSPKPPPPPDPNKTGAAQTATNIGTAVAQANLNNVNQLTPDGSLTYEQTDTYRYVDPLDGRVHEIPRFTATQRLSDQQQAIKDQTDRVSLNFATLGADQSARLNDMLSRPVDVGNLPERADPNNIRQANLQRIGSGPRLQSDLGYTGNVQSRAVADYHPKYIERSQIEKSPINERFFDRRSEIAPTQNNIQSRAQSNFRIQSDFADAGPVTGTYGKGFSEDRQRVEDALNQRLNPQLDRRREQLESRLASQGIRLGSEAYKDAMDDFNRGANDARLGVISAAGQEQSRLEALAAQRATFENQAQAQRYGQNMQRAAFGNQAQAQGFGQSFQNAGLNNQAQAQEFTQNYERSKFDRDSRNFEFGQRLQDASFRNQAQNQEYSQALQNAEFNRQLEAQRFGQGITDAQLNNAAQQQRFDQAAQRANFWNTTEQRKFDNQNVAIQANNQAALQEFNADAARFDAINTNRNQALQEKFAIRNQPINEITALLSGSQVSQPNFVNTPTTQIAPTDYGRIVNENYAQRLNAWQAQNQQRNSLLSGVFGLGSNLLGGLFSDRRLKTDIKRVGKTNDGQNIYSFRYKSGGPIQMGLMAQEVEKRKPKAVAKVGGVRMVDYGKALA